MTPPKHFPRIPPRRPPTAATASASCRSSSSWPPLGVAVRLRHRRHQRRLPDLNQDFQLTTLAESLVVSSLVCGKVSDSHGRRRIIVLLSEIFVLGTLSWTFAPTTEVMVIARFVLGLAVGRASITMPVYLAEMSSKHLRGQLVTRQDFMLGLISNAAITHLYEGEHTWR